METRPYRGEIDYERLAQYFRALSVPARVLLLQRLQVPRTSAEIELPPFRQDRELRQDRVLSRQTVEAHVEKLVEVGLVRSREARREGLPVREYLVHSARLFAFVDELRRVSLLHPSPGEAAAWGTEGGAGTMAAGAPKPTPRALPHGPALVLASGPVEGIAFPLAGDGPWTVGRANGVAAAIPYDPYVSAENAEIFRTADGFFVRDLPSSSNGTMLNWSLLAKGEAAPLHPGDLLSVGRSLLVFRNR